MSRELAILEKLEKELSLKQLQIKSLLTITQAINKNVSQDGLYNMYKSFLSWEMGVSKMVLYVLEEEEWLCTSHINIETEWIINEIALVIHNFERLHTVKHDDPEVLQAFDIIIPVMHKDHPIAYAVIGGIKDQEDVYNKIQFITTITNIIAVAIENKRLFKKQIRQERFKKEIELASEVQKMLIPEKLPINDQYELSKIYKPHFNVGGDYLDYIKFDDNKFAFCIADISGKGVAAALLMANFQAIIQGLIFQYRDLETFVFALNQSVFRITKSDKYITFFIAEVDVSTMKLRYINAGHYPPFLYQNGKTRRLDKGCTIIGAFEKLPHIEEEELDLEHNSMIFSFTDGLVDLRNEIGDYFEDEKIDNFIKTNSNESAEAFNNLLLSEIDQFKGNQSYPDDIAILTCKVL
jgi:sigma-B regulation protein RsbU (phosphoserine phosphatase)